MKKLNKKGQFLTVGILLALALVLFVVFGGVSLVLLVLKASLFYVIGGAMIVLALTSFLIRKPAMPMNLTFVVLIIGTVLVVLPIMVDTLKGLSIASIMP